MDLWVVNTRAVGPGCGMFRALQPSEAPGPGAFWPLGQVPAEGGCRLREWNRVGGGGALGIRPVGIDRRPAPVLGAVPGRTSPDA
jgi:hypothetical protein